MAEFKFNDVFGFDPVEAAEVRRAQQMIVDAMLKNMAHRITIAGDIQADLSRDLDKGIGDSVSVLSFAGGMQKVEQETTQAQTLFDVAANLAKTSGFVILGTVEDFEVRRIFGLATIHRPGLNGVEQQRVKAVLEALAAAYYVAEEELRSAQNLRSYQPIQKDIDVETTLEQHVAGWKARFWEGHKVATRIGYPVKKTRDEHLPLWDGFGACYRNISTWFENRHFFVKKARKAGLI